MCYALVRKSSFRQSYPQGKRTRTCQHRKHKQLADLNRLILCKNSLETLQVCTKLINETKPKILFPDLKILDVSHNKISKLPQGIGGLKNLLSLLVGHNSSLSVLPSELGLCTNLYELRIDSLHLKDPPKNVIDHATRDGRIDVRSVTGYLKSLHDKYVFVSFILPQICVEE